jgi:hypothetical protein
MYVEESLVRERQQERLRRAQQEQSARAVLDLRKLQRRHQRAERQLQAARQRVERLRSMLETAG